MIELELTLPNKLGLHARSAAKLVSLASRLNITLTISRDTEQWIDARNIMGLLMLSAGQGTLLQFRIEGEQAEEGKNELEDLFARNFDED